MIWASGDTTQGYPHLWHCLGCGREMLADADEQRRDDRLREQLAVSGSPHYDRLS
jgi:hypothetical protein